MRGRTEWFHYFEDIYKNDYLYIYNIGYFDYRIRKATEGKEMKVTKNATFHFVTGGKGTFVYDGQAYSVHAGDVFSMPSGVPFAFYPDEEDPWQYYWFNVSGEGVAEILSRIGISKNHPVLSTEKMPQIQEKFDELLDSEFNYGEFYYRALSTLYYIISFFIEEGKIPSETTYSDTIVGQAKEMILRNYKNENFSVCDIHKAVHVSEPYLRKIFKHTTGKTLSAFLINCRLSKAADLLRAHDYSIREICDRVGYSDEVYFIREFKKHYGVPPKKYRRLLLSKEI